VVEADLDQASEEADAEREPAYPRRQSRTEAQRVAVVAHAPEAVHGREPRASERAHVHPVAHVVLQVVDVHQRRLTEVVVSQLEVADLSGDDCLRARRQR